MADPRPKRTITVVLSEIATLEKHLREAPPHHGAGTRDAGYATLDRLRRELQELRTK